MKMLFIDDPMFPCRDYLTKNNIEIINNVGGGKIQSSSWLLKSVPDLGKIDKD